MTIQRGKRVRGAHTIESLPEELASVVVPKRRPPRPQPEFDRRPLWVGIALAAIFMLVSLFYNGGHDERIPTAVEPTGAGGGEQQTAGGGEALPQRWVHERVNMRAGPGTEHPVIDTLQPGDRLQLSGSEGSWSEVLTETWNRGYVYTPLLKESPP